jgi:hypothetical protein
MQTNTLNSIVREALLDRQLSLHYYLPFLHHGLRCLRTLSESYDFGGNVKEEKLTLNSYDRIGIPATAIDVIDIFGLYGDQRKQFTYNGGLTNIYNLDGATKISYVEKVSTMPEYIGDPGSLPLEQTGHSEYPTIFYPSSDHKYEYNIDNENSEIVIKVDHGLTDIYVRYLASGVSTSSANLVHPYAIDSLLAFMDWKFSTTDGSPQSKVYELKQHYADERRNLAAKMNPLSIQQIAEILKNA